MRVTKIKIKNIYGVSEQTLDGKSVELTGKTGTGKSSVLDAIKVCLTNRSDRKYIIKQGETEGEIYIECDNGLTIDRKIRTEKADSIRVVDDNKVSKTPQSFLNGIFTELQLDPIGFISKTPAEQNRIILNLIDFKWDLNWIKEKFGEIPSGVDYHKHILEVLNDIQSEKGIYYLTRQDKNRDLRNKLLFIQDISKTMPDNYDYNKWNTYNIGEKYKELEKIRQSNNRIERAKLFKSDYDNKVRGYDADKEISIAALNKEFSQKKTDLTEEIARYEELIKSKKNELVNLDNTLNDKIKLVESEYREKIAKLDTDTATADKFASLTPISTKELEDEINTAEEMRKHLKDYEHIVQLNNECDKLKVETDELTRKIELARNLPGEILKEATLPIESLTIENGVPLINGLPISNLSDGQKLKLSVEIATSKVDRLKIILLDGTEKLDTETRNQLYALCKEKGLQFIATRTTDDDSVIVTEL